jgi:asparagine synthase (glutamine-hydrolysing)
LRAGRVGRAIREVLAIRSRHPELQRTLGVRTAAALLPWGIRTRVARRARTPAWFDGRIATEPRSPTGVAPKNALRAQIHRDLTVGLRHLLRVADHNSMAHSVESRLPFLDVHLLETFYAAPAETKLQNGVTKVSLRRGMDGLLPRAIVDRHDKVGFSTPEETWFRTSLRDVVERTIASRSFRGRPWLRHEEVDATWRRFLEGDNGPTREVWRWLNLELWSRAYVD